MNRTKSNFPMMLPQLDFGSQRYFVQTIESKLIQYYLDSALEDHADFRELCNLLRTADEQDTIVLHINSVGGDVSIALQIMNAIEECIGTVVGHIESDAHSCASFIFLSCDMWSVSEHSSMLLHTASGGAFGKISEMFASAEHTNKWINNLCTKVYSGFLSPEELDNMLKGQDIYLTAPEIEERLENLVAYREGLMTPPAVVPPKKAPAKKKAVVKK